MINKIKLVKYVLITLFFITLFKVSVLIGEEACYSLFGLNSPSVEKFIIAFSDEEVETLDDKDEYFAVIDK